LVDSLETGSVPAGWRNVRLPPLPRMAPTSTCSLAEHNRDTFVA
jgi:hypothetical protein